MVKKAADAFRTISEVSDALDTPAHVLRFWESKFTQVKPVKRAGGRRYYRPDDINLLSGIKTLLHNQGMTIKGAQKLLREQGVKHVAAITPIVPLEDGTASRPAPVKTAKSAPVSAPDAAPSTSTASETAKAVKPEVSVDPAPRKPKENLEPEIDNLFARDTAIELPSIPDERAEAASGLLSVLTKADETKLNGPKIAPYVARLKALSARMSA